MDNYLGPSAVYNGSITVKATGQEASPGIHTSFGTLKPGLLPVHLVNLLLS